jgi:hypothetical protein
MPGVTKNNWRYKMVDVKKHLDLLGMTAEDKVTGFKGVIASISFDLYGCIQAIINPGIDKDGKLKDQCWFDIGRLKITGKSPVMDRPDFQPSPVPGQKKGPAEKPAFTKA